jgi:hypothetical protein
MKRAFLSVRLGLEAVIIVALLKRTFELIDFMMTGTRVHLALGLLGITVAIFIAAILVLDALRVRVKLNDLDAAQFPPASE